MGTPRIKIRKVEIFWNKIILTGCKWSSLNAQSTETPVSHSRLTFAAPLSGVIRNWTPQYKDLKGVKFLEQYELKRLQMVQFECPG